MSKSFLLGPSALFGAVVLSVDTGNAVDRPVKDFGGHTCNPSPDGCTRQATRGAVRGAPGREGTGKAGDAFFALASVQGRTAGKAAVGSVYGQGGAPGRACGSHRFARFRGLSSVLDGSSTMRAKCAFPARFR